MNINHHSSSQKFSNHKLFPTKSRYTSPNPLQKSGILKLVFIIFLFLLFSRFEVHSESSQLTEKQKINFLLEELERSNLRFIRNGDEYTAREAKEHMLKKLDYAGDRVRTAEQFISYIATKSSLSGKPYYVLFPDGKKIESGKWLSEKLNKLGEKQ